jgi:hypothetical protein
MVDPAGGDIVQDRPVGLLEKALDLSLQPGFAEKAGIVGLAGKDEPAGVINEGFDATNRLPPVLGLNEKSFALPSDLGV